MRAFIFAVMMTVAVVAMAKEQKINVPEGSSEATERAILALEPGVVDSTLWSRLGEYRYGDDPKLIHVLEAAMISAGVENSGRIEEELLKVINSRNSTDVGRQFACRLLQRVGTEKCVSTLSSLLTDEDMSHFARLAIESIPAPEAIRNALSKAPDSLKPGLIGSIGEIGGNVDVPVLAQYAAHEDRALAGSAMTSLAKIGTVDALRALTRIRPDDRLKDTHRDALMSVALINKDASVFKNLYAESDEGRDAVLRGWLRVEEATAVREICNSLAGEDENLRRAALQIVNTEPSRMLTKELRSKLSSVGDKAIQMDLISALGTRGDGSAMTTLLSLAEDSDVDIANSAITALGQLNAHESINLLLEKLDEPPHSEAAGNALAAIHAQGVDALLITALQDEDRTVQAINALARRMARSAAPAILQRLNATSEEVRKAAWCAVPEVCSASDTEIIMNNLLQLNDAADLNPAMKSVKSFVANVDDMEACFNAALKFNDRASEPVKNLIFAIGARVGTPEALEMVKSAYASDDKALKAKALRYLSAWPTINAATTLMDLAENGEDEETRIQALRGYIRLADLDWRELVDDKNNFDAGMNEKYQMLLWASKRATRNQEVIKIVNALGEMGHTKTMQELELVMTYIHDLEVREEAELAALNLVKRLAKRKPAEVLPIAEKLHETAQSKHVKFHANKAIEICLAAGAAAK